MSILLLPATTQEQLKSSTQINTLVDVVEELLKNAIDAGASKVDIEVDFTRGFCSVLDDGNGIKPFEFLEGANLARLNCELLRYANGRILTVQAHPKLNSSIVWGAEAASWLTCPPSRSLPSAPSTQHLLLRVRSSSSSHKSSLATYMSQPRS